MTNDELRIKSSNPISQTAIVYTKLRMTNNPGVWVNSSFAIRHS